MKFMNEYIAYQLSYNSAVHVDLMLVIFVRVNIGTHLILKYLSKRGMSAVASEVSSPVLAFIAFR